LFLYSDSVFLLYELTDLFQAKLWCCILRCFKFGLAFLSGYPLQTYRQYSVYCSGESFKSIYHSFHSFCMFLNCTRWETML